MPLLAPDVPVVTWWHGPPPDEDRPRPARRRRRPADHRLRAGRRPDGRAARPGRGLRARRHRPGLDPDHPVAHPARRRVRHRHRAAGERAGRRGGGQPDRRCCSPVGCAARLGVDARAVRPASGPGITEVSLTPRRRQRARRSPGRTATPRCCAAPGVEDRYAAAAPAQVGDELAEELRRLDADQPYAAALGAATGVHDLDDRPRSARSPVAGPAAGRHAGVVRFAP